jgi:hypothetical protein
MAHYWTNVCTEFRNNPGLQFEWVFWCFMDWSYLLYILITLSPCLLHWEELSYGTTPDQSDLARYPPSDVHCRLHIFKQIHIPTACPFTCMHEATLELMN